MRRWLNYNSHPSVGPSARFQCLWKELITHVVLCRWGNRAGGAGGRRQAGERLASVPQWQPAENPAGLGQFLLCRKDTLGLLLLAKVNPLSLWSLYDSLEICASSLFSSLSVSLLIGSWWYMPQQQSSPKILQLRTWVRYTWTDLNHTSLLFYCWTCNHVY